MKVELAGSTPRDLVLRGIAWMLGGTLLFAVVNVLVKALAQGYPIVQIMFFRAALALVLPLTVIAWMRRWTLLRPRRPLGHVLRSCAGIFAMATTFAAFRYIPAAEVIGISFAAPLFVTALSMPLLGEAVGWRRWTAVLVGFAGVVMMLQPGESLFSGTDGAALGGLLALAAAFGYAIVVITIRQLSRDDHALTIVITYMGLVTALTLPPLPFVWITPVGTDWLLFVALGLVGGMAQICMTYAMRDAPPAVVMPFDYSNLLFTTLLAWWIFAELPGGHAMIGAALIIACGFYILQREARLARLKPPSAR
jgi:drug/metabolite transporter (DMT)-like permease